MSLTKFNPRTTALLLFILVTGALRVVLNSSPELFFLSNFSPVGAMALFGGAYFNRSWKAFGFPLLTLFLSDVVLSLFVFKSGFMYGGWYWVYGAFILMTLTGRLLVKKTAAHTLLLSALVCTLIHWLVTDFSVWMRSALYPKTVSGFADCLLVAIPFELRFLTGTILYASILFGAFEWMQRKYFSVASV